MAIDQARHYHLSGSADLDGSFRLREVLNPASGTNRTNSGNFPVDNQYGAIFDYSEMLQFCASARPGGPVQGEKLSRLPNQNILHATGC